MSKKIVLTTEQGTREFFALLKPTVEMLIRDIYGDIHAKCFDGRIYALPDIFNFEFGDAMDISRPIDTEKLKGKLCWFWGKHTSINDKCVGIYNRYDTDLGLHQTVDGREYKNCRPFSKEEIVAFTKE